MVHDVDASGGLVAVATSRGLAIYTKDGSRFLNRDLLGDRDCRDVEIAAGLIYCASEAGLIEVFDLNSSFRADHIAELVGSEVLPGEHIALDRGVAWVTSGDVLTALELGATASMSLVRSASGEMGDMSLEGASVLASTATEILSSFTYPINPTRPVSISVSLPSPPLVKHWGKTMMVIAHPGSGSSAFALAPNRVATTATSVARPAACPAPFVVSDMRVDGDILYLVGSTGAEVWNLGARSGTGVLTPTCIGRASRAGLTHMSNVVDGRFPVADSGDNVHFVTFTGTGVSLTASTSRALVSDTIEDLVLVNSSLGYASSAGGIDIFEDTAGVVAPTGARNKTGARAMALGGTFLAAGAPLFRGSPELGLRGIPITSVTDLRKSGPISTIVNGPVFVTVAGARIVAVNEETGLDVVQMAR